MAKSKSPARKRVGKVSVYVHHGAWWLYYRENGRPVRKKIGLDSQEALRVAAQINAQLVQGAPAMLSFTSVSVAELRKQFLDHHEQVRGTTLATVMPTTARSSPRVKRSSAVAPPAAQSTRPRSAPG